MHPPFPVSIWQKKMTRHFFRERLYFAAGFGMIQCVKALMSYEDDVRVIATDVFNDCCVLLSHLTGPSIRDGPHQAGKYNCERTSEEGRLTSFPPRWLRDRQHRRQLGQKHDRRRASCRTGVCREFIRKGKASFPLSPPPHTTPTTRVLSLANLMADVRLCWGLFIPATGSHLSRKRTCIFPYLTFLNRF
jgi:hypothetical protein